MEKDHVETRRHILCHLPNHQNFILLEKAFEIEIYFFHLRKPIVDVRNMDILEFNLGYGFKLELTIWSLWVKNKC